MMTATLHRATSSRRRMRGAVNLLAVMFLITVIMAVLATTLTMTSSDIFDSTAQGNSVKALFLAETAAERAAGRMAGGTACASLAPDSASLGSGTVSITAAAVVGANCQIRVSGTIAGATRTVDVSVVNAGGSAIAFEARTSQGNNTPVASRTIPFTVGGSGRVLVVGITVDTANGSVVNTVTYAGIALARPFPMTSGVGSSPLTDIWTLANPNTGTNDVVVTMSGSDQMAVGVVSFTGADISSATAHLDGSAVTASGSSNTASVTITPVTNNAWIVDTVSVNNGVSITMTAMTNRSERWNIRMGSSATGGGSTLGPVSPAAARTLTWGGFTSRNWSQAAVAIKPGSSPRLVQWQEVVD